MKISGEFRQCQVCRVPLSAQYPEGTNFTHEATWWGDEYVTAHRPDCPQRFPEVVVAEPQDVDGISR